MAEDVVQGRILHTHRNKPGKCPVFVCDGVVPRSPLIVPLAAELKAVFPNVRGSNENTD